MEGGAKSHVVSTWFWNYWP